MRCSSSTILPACPLSISTEIACIARASNETGSLILDEGYVHAVIIIMARCSDPRLHAWQMIICSRSIGKLRGGQVDYTGMRVLDEGKSRCYFVVCFVVVVVIIITFIIIL